MSGELGVTFVGWPDGGPTSEQENCVVDVVRMVLDEVRRAKSSE